MTSTRLLALVVGFVSIATVLNAQGVVVDRQNRTIEISAESSIAVTADRVSITVTYRNFGPTHDQAFADNARIAARILQAWKDAGVPEKAISTSALTSNFIDTSQMDNLTPEERKERSYQVAQSWRITETPQAAEKLLDIAVDAGANEVGNPEWSLSDGSATESAAYASALQRAHTIAEQMATSFGSKVGALLYASNEARPQAFGSGVAGGVMGGVIGSLPASRPNTQLLPQKIEKSAYVRAIFSLE